VTHHLLRERPYPGVLLLTFNRPERKNALDQATTLAFLEEIQASGTDAETRVIVVTGAGGNYSSGADLEDFQNLAQRTNPPIGQRMMEALNSASKPVIAAVEGLAVGGSVTMLLHFDIVYASRSARFRLPFVDLGTCPEGASSYYLPLLAGHRKAAELLMLGEFFSAETACAIGLVNATTDDGAALQAALVSAQKLAAKSTESLRLTKMLLRDGHREAVRRVMDHEHGLFTERLHSAEVQAKIATMRGAKKGTPQ
jgi:enoyl-CoA hydratase/carnithine racemase